MKSAWGLLPLGAALGEAHSLVIRAELTHVLPFLFLNSMRFHLLEVAILHIIKHKRRRMKNKGKELLFMDEVA